GEEGGGGLDRVGRAHPVNSDEQAKGRGGSPAASSSSGRRVGLSRDETDELPRDGGPDPSLCAGALSLWTNGERVDARRQYHSGLRAAARRGRHPADQRVRGPLGGGGEAGGCQGRGGGHDRARGRGPVSERNASDGNVRVGRGGGEQERGRGAEGLRAGRGASLRASEAEAARVSLVRQEEEQGRADAVDGGDGRGRREGPAQADDSVGGSDEPRVAAGALQESGLGPAREAASHDADALAADPLLDSNRPGRGQQDRELADPRGLLAGPRESRQADRVRTQLGYHAAPRRIPIGAPCQGSARAPRRPLRCRGGQRSYRLLRE